MRALLLSIHTHARLTTTTLSLPSFFITVTLFRAYFADNEPREKRTGRFGLIGVLTSFSLFVGPSLGGEVAKRFGRRAGCMLSAGLCVLAAFIAFLWQPDESKVDEKFLKRSVSANLAGEELEEHLKTHKTVNGVKMVKIDLSEAEEHADAPFPVDQASPRANRDPFAEPTCWDYKPCRVARKAWRFAKWLGQYDLWPLLSLNFVFRFAFAAYKSVFAFFCIAMLSYGSREVGYLLSCMGLGGMLVQGVLVRVIVSRLGEERTLFCSMLCTSAGFVVLSYSTSLALLAPALTLIAIGYGLAVPCLTTLFSHVPVEQGIMQGIAGAIDRFGQAFGPIVGGALLQILGEAWLMRWTGIFLAAVSAACLVYIGDGCMSWMRELICHPAAGYRPVGQELEAIEEEEDGLEMEERSPQPSPKAKASEPPLAPQPAPAVNGGFMSALSATPLFAQPAGGR